MFKYIYISKKYYGSKKILEMCISTRCLCYVYRHACTYVTFPGQVPQKRDSRDVRRPNHIANRSLLARDWQCSFCTKAHLFLRNPAVAQSWYIYAHHPVGNPSLQNTLSVYKYKMF
jgi:hypothetical protein